MPEMSETNPGGLKGLNLALKSLEGVQGKVGWFESSKYPDGTSVAYVATIQEHGVPERSIPARPFMRPTAQQQGNAWRDFAVSLSGKMVKGAVSAHDVMELLTIKAEGDIAKYIESVNAPALSDITLVLRKWKDEGRTITGRTVGEAARALREGTVDISSVRAKPLDDSGLMIATLTSVVEKV